MEGERDVRESLLDVMQKRIQRLREQNGSVNLMIHRLIYVARAVTVPLRGENLSALHERVFAKLNRESDPVFGLLLAYPNCCCVVIESTSRALRALLTALGAVPSNERIVSDIRILSCIENVPRALYPSWSWRSFGGTAGDDQGEDGLKTQQTVIDTVQGLTKFGKQLDKAVQEGKAAQVLETAKAGGSDLLPSSNAVVALTKSAFTVPLETYAALYLSPVDIKIEGERVFPARGVIKY